jgi:V8-like Glu-specific endopeptidase
MKMEVEMRYKLTSLLRCAFVAAPAILGVMTGEISAQQVSGPVSTPATSMSQQSAADFLAKAYWTPERMAAAIPMEKFAVGHAFAAQSPSVAAPIGTPGFSAGASPAMAQANSPMIGQSALFPAYTAQPLDFGSAPSNPRDGPYGPFQRFGQAGAYVQYPISTVGKLFFNIPANNAGITPGAYVCSGTAINRSTIVTAGHCVAAGDNSTFFNTWLFCPSYNAGGVNPAVGCWSWASATTSGPWFSTGNVNYDYACIVTPVTGTLLAKKMGNVVGWAARGWNWPSSMLEVSLGYPQAAPFDGKRIQANAAPDWYSYAFGASTGGVGASKIMANDLTGGSSGGPWILGYANGSTGAEYGDVDGNSQTDPGFFAVNGVNSHKRCAVNCNSPPTTTQGVFWNEMSSPRFTSTGGADVNDSEAVFGKCFANANNN